MAGLETNTFFQIHESLQPPYQPIKRVRPATSTFTPTEITALALAGEIIVIETKNKAKKKRK